MTGKVVIVTGAAGAIGRQVTSLAAERGWRVLGLGHGAPLADAPLEGWINGDVSAENLANLAAAHGAPDAIIHLAGGSAVGPSLRAPAEDFNRTVATATHLLDWVRRSAPDCGVALASSAAVYGEAGAGPIAEDAPRRPVSPYGFHKLMMELAAESYAAAFGLRCAIVRLFSVYGPGLRKQLIWELCSRLKGGDRALRLGGSGEETRDWVHISDAANMLLAAAEIASDGPTILNGCTGIATSIAQTAAILAGAFAGQAAVSFSGDQRPGDPRHLVGDPSRAASKGLSAAVAPNVGLADTGGASAADIA